MGKPRRDDNWIGRAVKLTGCGVMKMLDKHRLRAASGITFKVAEATAPVTLAGWAESIAGDRYFCDLICIGSGMRYPGFNLYDVTLA